MEEPDFIQIPGMLLYYQREKNAAVRPTTPTPAQIQHGTILRGMIDQGYHTLAVGSKLGIWITEHKNSGRLAEILWYIGQAPKEIAANPDRRRRTVA